jgi:hypothetical protein
MSIKNKFNITTQQNTTDLKAGSGDNYSNSQSTQRLLFAVISPDWLRRVFWAFRLILLPLSVAF